MGLVTQYCERRLGLVQNVERWTLQGILNHDISSLLFFLVELAHAVKCPYAFPTHVSIAITCKQVWVLI